jgi:hypothetical protein
MTIRIQAEEGVDVGIFYPVSPFLFSSCSLSCKLINKRGVRR